MRKHLAAAFALAAVASLSSVASLAIGAPAAKIKPIDLSASFARVDVYRDEAGKYYVVPRSLADDGDKLVFYGDGKTMYQQRIVGSGSDDKGLDLYLWAPRVIGLRQATLSIKNGKPFVECKGEEHIALTLVPADQGEAGADVGDVLAAAVATPVRVARARRRRRLLLRRSPVRRGRR